MRKLWIPFWSSIKLAAIFWLIIPGFHGAYYAYQRFVRPIVYMHPSIVRRLRHSA
ncbi:hypothetical protein CASFOL_009027 [Castilleja foliolosa]|uniref:HVA22-like protein n=1 Tax=Castilleja foliolosa TaxID=1961234 RepID=A0ABD3E1Q0_9LAMI